MEKRTGSILNIEFWQIRQLLEIPKLGLKVKAVGRLATGRYNITAPFESPPIGRIATVKVPASAIAQTVPQARGGGINTSTLTIPGAKSAVFTQRTPGAPDTIYEFIPGKWSQTDYNFKTPSTSNKGTPGNSKASGISSIHTVIPRITPSNQLADCYLISEAARYRFQGKPTIAIKSDIDAVLDALQEFGGAILMVRM